MFEVNINDGALSAPTQSHSHALVQIRLRTIEPNPGPKGNKKKSNNKQMNQKPPKQQQSGSNGLLSNIGGLAGAAFGGPAGAVLGKAAGSLLAKITGWGSYSVSQNTILAGAPPTFSGSDKGLRIAHREFITDIEGSTAFTLDAYNVNPGLSASFPFLSQIAANFEEYHFNGLVFEFKTTSGTAISSSDAALGTVVMATNYDVADNLFVNKQQMESYEFATSCVPFQSCIHPVECAPNTDVLENLYMRTGAVASTDDLRFYDKGMFQIATVGQQSAYTLGELWVSYDVTLMKPRLIIGNSNLLYAHLRESSLASATAAAPFGTAGPLVGPYSTITGISGSATTFIIPNVGTYVITGFWYSVSANIASVAAFSLGSNLTKLTTLADNTSTAAYNYTSTEALIFMAINCSTAGTGAANTVTVSGLTSMSGATTDILICQVPVSTTTV
jgi:hypothetical protein